MLEQNKIHNGDCMELMPKIRDQSVDLILCDLPYGILACKWDVKLPFDALFEQYNRIIKDNGAIVLTATCKFAIDLINANRKYFRYDLVWEKTLAVGFANSKKMPMRSHELILVFYKHLPTYNPQGLIEIEKKKEKRKVFADKDYAYRTDSMDRAYTQHFTNYPRSVLKFSNGNHNNVHPTQKPLELFEYLIKTYTNEGDLVLDNCIGSGTTAIACINTNRQFIGIEKDEHYFEVAQQRVRNHLNELPSKIAYN